MPSPKLEPLNKLPLDVWMLESPDGSEVTHEANTFRDGGRYRIDWIQTSVGQVRSLYWDTPEQVRLWYHRNGFRDFTTE